MANDDAQSLLLEHQIEAVIGHLRLVVHTLGSRGQAIWHVAERAVPPATAGWVSIASGREQTTTAAMSIAEAEADRLVKAVAISDNLRPVEHARLKHLGVEFFLAPIVPTGTRWTIYPMSGPTDGADSGVVLGGGSFQAAVAVAQATIGTWLLSHPDDQVCSIH